MSIKTRDLNGGWRESIWRESLQ